MPAETLLWYLVFLLHVAILAQLSISGKFRRMPYFAALIAQDIFQTVVLLYVYHRLPSHYLIAYTIGKSADIVLTFLAIADMLSKEKKSVIGITLEYYMMAEMIIHYACGMGYPDYWNRVEWFMKPVYIAIEVVWLMTLTKGGWYVDRTD
jgi:hypothetical protein